MKNKLLFTLLTFIALCAFPSENFGQVINLGTAKNFVLFTTVGAVTNTGTTHLTGNVGSNIGSSTGFGNVDGVMHDQDGASAAAGADLATAYGQLNTAIPTLFPGTLLGNGVTLNAGVYSIPAPTVLNLTLNLDAQGNPNAVFIFQIGGAFSTNAQAKVKLLNGALACNVYWKVEGAVSMATGTTMRGSVIANNAAITMSAGDTLEGRALSINGAVSVTNLFAYTPTGCGSPTLTGPANPVLGTTECFSLFAGIGQVTNSGITNATGDVGTNSGLTTGFNPLLVTGMIHPIPDLVTAQCGTDFTNVYNNINLIPHDIQLLYPAQFGNNLVLTPHTYWMNGAVSFTDTLYLNATGNPNAVFVIKVNGAFSTSTYSKVILINGAQAKNVYWKIDGAVDINDYSIFRGTIIAQGAVNLYTGVTLYGRALTGVGALTTSAVNVIMPTSCAPFTTTEPTNQIVCLGGTATFSVNTTGLGLSYQWRKGNVNLTNGGSISGANTTTLIINPVTALDVASNYNVIISGSFLPNDTSNFASLTLTTAPSITTQPTNQTVCAGNNATFSVVATGSNLTYQWRKGTVNIVGETNATLILTAVTALDVATNYNVVVSGACLPTDISNNVSLTLTTAPTITTQPTNQTVCTGNNATFSVVASGSNLTYQWRKGTVNIVGATTASLTLPSVTVLDVASNYNVIVSGACLPTDVSNNVSLTLTTAPIITTQPTNQTVCAGNNATFSVVASGSNLTYQWRKGTVNIAGETNATLVLTAVTALDVATNYNVVVTGACLPKDISNNVSLTLTTAPSITTQPTNQTVCAGNNATFSVVASGSNLTYQWRKGTVNITGETNATLVLTAVTALDVATNYNVIVSGACLPTDVSNNVSLTLTTAPIITTQPSNQTVCAGNNATFTVIASGSNLTYQWRKGTVNITGETNATLILNSVTALDVATNYNVIVSGTCLPTDVSNNVSLTLTTAPSITTQPTNQTVCTVDNATFTVIASGSNLTYQWRKGTVNIAGETNASLVLTSVTALDVATNYNVVVSGTCLPSDISNNVSLTLTTAPSITTQPTNQTVCAGDNATFTVIASGLNLTYQWRKGTVNTTGETNASLTLNAVTALDVASNYNVIVSGACLPTDVSNNVSLTLTTAPSITTQPTNQTVCAGNNATFTVIASGSNLTYQWRKGTVNIAGETNATLVLTAVTALDVATNYNVVVSGTCLPSDISNNTSLTLTTAPLITTQPTNQTVCSGNNATFSVISSGSNLTYQWRKGTVNIVGETNATLTLNAVTVLDVATNYNVVVTGACLPTDVSNNVSLTLTTAPSITTQPTNQTVCAGDNATFSIIASGSNLTYQWRKGTVNIAGETNASLVLTSVTALDVATNYNVIVSGACLPTDVSNNVSLTLTTAPTINTQPMNQTVCAGSDATFTVIASGSNLTYQWFKGTIIIPGQTNATLVLTAVTALDLATNYNVVVSGTCAPNDTSNFASLTFAAPPVITTQPTNQTVCAGDNATFLVIASGSNLSYQWRKGTVNVVGGTNATLTLNVVTALDVAVNYNVIVSGTCAPNDTSDLVTLVMNVCSIDLSVVKTCSDSTPSIGTTILFTIVARNNSVVDASGVSVIELLQSGYVYVSSSMTAGTYNHITGIWNIGTLNAESSATLTIAVAVASNGIYSNSVSISGNEPDLTPANDTTTITLYPIDFFIPQGFSPNGDGINDLFVIRGIFNYPNNSITIYNRWGGKVFEASPYTNTWNGTSQSDFNIGGNVLPVGTYFYVLDLGNESDALKGTIYLNK